MDDSDSITEQLQDWAFGILDRSYASREEDIERGAIAAGWLLAEAFGRGWFELSEFTSPTDTIEGILKDCAPRGSPAWEKIAQAMVIGYERWPERLM